MEMHSVSREIHSFNQELNVDLVPGTEVMTDIGNHHFVKSKGRSPKVLVPQPSNDRNDPLNWSMKWKVICIVAASFATLAQAFGPQASGPMVFSYMVEFGITPDQATKPMLVAGLLLAFSNFVWVPMSRAFGRRPVFLLSSLLCCISCIWCARSTSYLSFMAACAVNGFAAGASQTIQLEVIADIFFLHSRGAWNTLYWGVYIGSVASGPAGSGPMGSMISWQSFWWLNVGLTGAAFFVILFFFPETKWPRAHQPEPDSPVPVQEVRETKTSHSNENIEFSSRSPPASVEQFVHMAPWLGRGRPTRSQWGLYQLNPRPLQSIVIEAWMPFKLFTFPIVQFASFVISFSYAAYWIAVLTQAPVLTQPPYGWSFKTVGMSGVAFLIGSGFAATFTGPLSDWLANRATIKNGGIREPEMRLPAMIPLIVIMFVGNIIMAYGYENGWSWPIIVVIGYGAVSFQCTGLPIIVGNYAMDSYLPITGSMFSHMAMNRNLWVYGVSKFLLPWCAKVGYVSPIMTNTALCTLWCLFGLLFYYKGKTFRRWTKDSVVHKLQ